MWTFDGEEWTQHGAGDEKAKPAPSVIRIDEFLPELQVIESVPVRPQTRRDIPMPFPIP